MERLLNLNLDPLEVAAVLGFSIGYLWGETFSDADWAIKNTESFKKLSSFRKWLVSHILDVTHHFQYGLVLYLVAIKSTGLAQYPLIQLIIIWLAWGLIVSDWKDYQYVLKRMGLKVSASTSI